MCQCHCNIYTWSKMYFVISGAKKLQNENNKNLKLFLDDGFEIDEDEILLSSMMDNRILVLASSMSLSQMGEY